MRFVFILFSILVFAGIYILLNFYIGLRSWQVLWRYLPFLDSKLYWLVFSALSATYIVGRLGKKIFPESINDVLIITGSYWMPIVLYSLMLIALMDILRALNKFTRIIPANIASSKAAVLICGISGIVIVLGIVFCGWWNARTPRITHYDINIPKQAGNVKELHIAMVSDIHLGIMVNKSRLTQLVERVNSLNADIVLFAGDIIDEDTGPLLMDGASDALRGLKQRYGVYAVLGNHEYISGHVAEAAKFFEKSGIHLLKDDYIKILDSIFIIGRDDKSGSRFNGKPRKSLQDVMNGIDKSKALILMDHQPSGLSEPQSNGIDLQLSGHTHKGQIFPGSFISSRVYEKDWGYLKKGDFQLIVSSGYGTWGPPVRVGSISEIVDIAIHFRP